MNSFFSHQTLESHPSIEITSLGGIQWENNFLQKTKEYSIDQMIKEHLNTFWSVYDLKLHYDFEHKVEHTADVIAYIRKADYALKIGDKIIYKVRGVHENQSNDSPVPYELFNLLLKDEIYSPIERRIHFQTQINTLFDYFTSVKKKKKLNQFGYLDLFDWFQKPFIIKMMVLFIQLILVG